MGSCRGWATGKVRRHEAPFEHNWNHSSQGFHPMLPQPWCCHLYFASSQTKALPLSLLVIRDKVSHFPKLVIAVKSSHLHSRGSSPPSTPSPCPSFTFLDSTNAQDSADVSSAVSRRPAIFNCPLQHPPWAQPPTWSNFSGPLPTSVPTTSKALRPIDLSLKKKKSNWRILALQYCTGFCHTSTWISHRYTYVPSLLNLPPTSHTSPPL